MAFKMGSNAEMGKSMSAGRTSARNGTEQRRSYIISQNSATPGGLKPRVPTGT